MSKIFPVSQLKLNSNALIHSIEKVKYDNSNAFTQNLVAKGFVPGREVKLLSRSFGMFITKVAQDNQIVLDKTAADSIMVVSDDINMSPNKESFFTKAILYFKKLKSKI